MITPPRLAERLLIRRLRGDVWGETTLGDLREEFADIATREGRAAAKRWYWRETFRLLLPAPPPQPDGPRSRKDSLMRTLFSEARLATRALWRQPPVSLAIIVTLAVGLGLNAATFGMMDALLLRPFAIPSIDRLVVLSELSASEPFPQESVAPGSYLDLKRHSAGAITRMTTVSWWDVNLSGGDRPERLQGSRVGADFFSMPRPHTR